MKNALSLCILAGLLGACAPALEQRVMTDSVTYVYTSRCAEVLPALENVAVRVQPGFFKGEGHWTPLDLQQRDRNRLVFLSRNDRSHLLGNGGAQQQIITTTATCLDAKGHAHLTLSSEGEIRPYLAQLHRMIYAAIRLP